MNRIALLVLVTTTLIGCDSKKPREEGISVGATETVVINSSPGDPPPDWNKQKFCTGVAQFSGDHSEKTERESVVIGNVAYLFRGDYRAFEEQDLGKMIRVSGTIKRGRLPMFIDDPKDKGTDELGGIPMPPGTDIAKESLYYFIENPKWEIISKSAEQQAGGSRDDH